MKLIGRTNEVVLLQSYVESQQAEFIAMYGRRRVGKTFLISNIFADMIVFETSGIIHGNSEDQFAAFNHSLRKIGYTGPYTKTWMESFFALEQTLTSKLTPNKRQVIFW